MSSGNVNSSQKQPKHIPDNWEDDEEEGEAQSAEEDSKKIWEAASVNLIRG
jgi:hypothetical protein